MPIEGVLDIPTNELVKVIDINKDAKSINDYTGKDKQEIMNDLNEELLCIDVEAVEMLKP